MARKRTETGGPPEQAFGRVLARLRKDRGLSQEGLAALTGGSRGYVSLLERGVNSATISMVFSLSAALGIRASELLELVEVDLQAEPQ